MWGVVARRNQTPSSDRGPKSHFYFYFIFIPKSQAVDPLPEVLPRPGPHRHLLQGGGVVQGQAVAEVGDGVVVGVHLLAHIPGLPRVAVAVLLHPAVPEVVLAPPPLVAVARPVHAPGLALRTDKCCHILYSIQAFKRRASVSDFTLR